MSNSRRPPNLEEASRHLAALDPSPKARFTFQTFQDNDETGRNPLLTCVLHGTLTEHAKTLADLNHRGAGVYVTVNETDGRGRKEKNITRIRAVFADQDNGPMRDYPIQPSLVVKSKRGDHPYFLLNGNATNEQFRAIQKAIISNLDSDPKVFDPPRVMRLAGFDHMKNPAQPYRVKIKSQSNAKYTVEELLKAFPVKSKSADEPAPSRAVTFEAFSNWVKTLPIEASVENRLGGRNITLLNLIREGLGCGIDPAWIRAEARDYCRRSKENPKVAEDMLRRQLAQHQESPFASFHVAPKKTYSAAEAAERYLTERGLDDGESLRLRYYKGEFYRYEGNRYVVVSHAELRADVMAFLQSSANTRKYSTLSFANNVVANLEGRTLVGSAVSIPSFLNDFEGSSSRLIAVESGILDLRRLIEGKSNYLISHTAAFFSLGCLPFDFVKDAKCPTWTKIIKRALPDHDLQRLLQEWFGYNLVFDYQFHKFVLLLGDGANGKSVILTVLRAILGSENYSAVGLEQFNPSRTFPLTRMIAKLANIVEEISEFDKVAEGVLKDLSAGGTMTVERKHKDAFEMKATARLTFATNVLPRFRDRSDGLWRRMMPIPFKVQIPPSEQDPRLAQTTFWESSGELPGVLNWAIQGLNRLYDQGHFTEPKAMRELLHEVKSEANPAATFLEENCSAQAGKSISASELFKRYSDWMLRQNSKPLNQTNFSKEVPRRFPSVTLTKNPRRQADGSRSREWLGISLIGGGKGDFS